MSHKLTRLSKSILEQPQLITAAKFEEIAEVLEDRNGNLNKSLSDANLLAEKGVSGGLVADTVGVLRVEGPTTYRASGFEALCGGCSYVSLINQMEELVKLEGVSTILMMVDSPGGEAYRCFETSRTLRKLADESSIKLIAYIDGMAASAGYGLASAAHEIIINPDAEAGSIGVVIRLQNNNKQQEEAGIRTKYITAGASKVPFDDEGEFRTEFLDGLQERVSELYDGFVSHVATMRNIDEKIVRSTEAKMFSAEKALELGLVDKVMEGAEFNEYLADASANNSSLIPQSIKTEILKTKEETLMSDNVNVEANAELVAQMKAMSDKLATYEAKEVESTKNELSTKLDSMTFLTECKEDLVTFLMSDASSESKSLLEGVISAAQAHHNELTVKATSDMAAVQEAHEKAITEAMAKVETATQEAELVIEEFAEPKAIEGDNTSITDNENVNAKSNALAQFITNNKNK